MWVLAVVRGVGDGGNGEKVWVMVAVVRGVGDSGKRCK